MTTLFKDDVLEYIVRKVLYLTAQAVAHSEVTSVRSMESVAKEAYRFYS